MDSRVAARLAQRAQVIVQTIAEDETEEAGDYASEGNTDAPVGPSAEEESDYLSGAADRGDLPLAAVKANEVEEDEPVGELPKLDELNRRIPKAALDIMDELFRAKFSKVQRVSAKHLKKG